MERSRWFLAGLLLCACVRPAEPPRSALPAPAQSEVLPASAFLAALPDGEAKRQFIIDCTGCHTFRAAIAYPAGQPRSRESWQDAVGRMVGSYGAQSGFPVIASERDAATTAQWLSAALPARSSIRWEWPAALEARADIREYRLPVPGDLPHDVAVAGDRVIVTGMFSAQMYILDPATGAVSTERTPQPNPRAIEIDRNGSWWVVLGNPRAVARRSPNGEWKTFDAGYYAHSVALAPDGGVWVNGHFTFNPELISRIDAATGERRDFTVPAHPRFSTTPVPYEIRVSDDGVVWMSELQGNRIIRLDPRSGQMKAWTLPTSASGPRRLDIGPDGVLWIPEYGANKLARFDPRTEKFEEYELPLKDTAPYIARYDRRRNVVWLGTGMSDALFRFDPRTQRFRYYRLPTGDALVRHFTIDARSGDLWLAPGSSPEAVPAARVVRLRPLD